jgi:hypothetical protein
LAEKAATFDSSFVNRFGAIRQFKGMSRGRVAGCAERDARAFTHKNTIGVKLIPIRFLDHP